MIGKLISLLFNFILKIVMTIIQLICLPLNALFDNVFPDFDKYITIINNGLNSAFSPLSWAISIIPPLVREVLLFIFTIELSIVLIMKSTRLTSRVWSILQKLKFW
uniref:Uncharacterized protein n=1 Tax=Inoviridae sp. ctDDr4 TaxID=2825777 RepID=A0A8S5V649_9VIRU|nr:MAG TPA: hypothetical protein [Inoviridae sp. ctDDr4]